MAMLCSVNVLFCQCFVQSMLYSGNVMFWQCYVLSMLCSVSVMFWEFYVLAMLCSVDAMLKLFRLLQKGNSEKIEINFLNNVHFSKNKIFLKQQNLKILKTQRTKLKKNFYKNRLKKVNIKQEFYCIKCGDIINSIFFGLFFSLQ